MEFNDIKDNIYKFTKKVASKTEEIAKISKIKMDIHKLKGELKKEYEALGIFVFEKRSEGEENISLISPDIIAFSQKITSHIDHINEMKDEIERIKAHADITEDEIQEFSEDNSEI